MYKKGELGVLALAIIVISALSLLVIADPKITGLITGEFEIQSTPLSICLTSGWNANTVYALINNVNSSGTCMQIDADNVTLDCRGKYLINYSQVSAGSGVYVTGYNFTTIRNCNIVQGNASNTHSYNINLNSANNGTIINNNITTSGNDGYGIYLYSGSTNTLSNNIITTSGSTGLGIYLYSGSNSNTLSDNIITTTSGPFSYGITLHTGSNSNTLSNNNITTYGINGSSIRLESGSNSNTLSNNTLITSGNHSLGIFLLSGSSSNNLTNNNITTFGYRSFGINFESGSNDSRIINNNIMTYNNDNTGIAYGIRLYNNNKNNFFGSNVITTYGLNGRGFSIEETSNYNVLNSNTVITYGTSSVGVSIQTGSSSNNLINNTLKSYGVDGKGIYLYIGNSNNFINNTVYSNQSWDFDTISSTENVITNLYLNSANISFTGENITLKSVASPSADPSSFKNISKYINITNNSASSWIYLNVSYNESQLGTAVESALKLYRYNATGAWELIPGSGVNITQHYVYGYSTKFSIFAPMSEVLNLTSCKTSNWAADTTYTLVTDVSSTGTCFQIDANNVTLDCRGYTINGTDIIDTDGLNNNGWNYTTIKNCIITNFGYGIHLSTTSNSKIINNTLYSNNVTGIILSSSSNNIVTNNLANLNFNGIYLSSSLNNTITNNTVNLNIKGIYLDSSSNNNTVTNNVLNSNSDYGTYSSYSSNNTLISNIVNSNNNGIYLYHGSDNTMADNIVNSNNLGIYLDSSSNNTLINNTANSNSLGIYLSSSSNNNKITSSTVNSNADGIILDSNSNSNNITDNIANLNNNGVSLYSNSNNTLINNTATSNSNYGIYLFSSSNNTLTNNTVINNTVWDFYSSSNSQNNTVTNLYTDSANISFTGLDVALKSVSSPPADTSDMMKNIGRYIHVTDNSASSWIYLNVSYNKSQLGSVIESSMKLYRYNDTTWVTTGINPNEIDVDANYVYGNTSTFTGGIFAPMGESTVLTSCKIDGWRSNVTYTLANSVSPSIDTGTCMRFDTNNVTLDCQNKYIYYSQGQEGNAINIYGYNLITIKNCNLNQLGGTYNTWMQTLQTDWDTWNNTNVDTFTTPGDVKIALTNILNPSFESDFINWVNTGWSISTSGPYAGTKYIIRNTPSDWGFGFDVAIQIGVNIVKSFSIPVYYTGWTQYTIPAEDLVSYIGKNISLRFETMGPQEASNIRSDFYVYTGGSITFYYKWRSTTASHFAQVDNIQTYYGTGDVYNLISPNTYLTSGNITSWGNFESSANVSAQTSLTYYIRSATNDTDLDNATWHAITPGSIITESLANNWIQLKVDFSTSNPAVTPVLHDIKVNFITGNNPLSNSPAVYLRETYNNTIQNSTITTLGQVSPGLLLQSGINSIISGNKITTTGSDAYGIQLDISSDSNTLIDNSFTTSGPDAFGIYLAYESNLNIFENNVVKTSSIDFVSSDDAGGQNNISSITFNSTSRPAKIGFTYSGGIQVNSATSRPNPSGLKNIRRYIEINNQSAATVFLKMFYDDSKLPVLEQSLWLYRYNGTDWLNVSGAGIDTVSNYVYGSITSFSTFAPLGSGSSTINLNACQTSDWYDDTTYVLTADVSSAGTCMQFDANNVTLNCQGHTINYSQGVEGRGIDVTGYNFTVIKNCNIVQGNSSLGGDSLPIFASYANNLVIQNNTLVVLPSGMGLTRGIAFGLVSNSSIIYNTIISSDSDGITIYSSSNNNITGNNINSSSNSIYLYPGSNSNVLTNNIITTNGNAGYGINCEFSDNNNLINNSINILGSSAKGIALVASNNILSDNKINVYGDFSTGISVEASYGNNSIYSSIINLFGAAERGILISQSSNNIFTDNTISSNYEYVYEGGEFESLNNAENNTINNLMLGSVDVSFTNLDIILQSITSDGLISYNANIDPADVKNLGKFVDITNNSDVSWAYVKFLYSDADVAYFNVSTLKVYRFDGLNWTALNDTLNETGVNADEKYVYANLSDSTNFSIFGVFGNQTTIPTPYCGDGSCNNGEDCSSCSADCGSCSVGGGGGTHKVGGGGGGGGAPVATVPTVPTPTEIKIEETPELQSEWTSGQSVSVSASAGGTITFNIDSENHSIVVKSVNAATGLVEVWIYSDPIAVSLAVGETREVDVNGDGINDISVTLNGINNGKADLSIINLAAVTGLACGNNVCEDGENSDSCCVDCSCSSGFECQPLQTTIAGGTPAPPVYKCVQVQARAASNILPILLVIVAMILWIAISVPIFLAQKSKGKSARLIEAEIKNTYKLLEGKMVDEAAKKYELLKKYYKDYAESIPPAKRRRLYTQILKLYSAITSHYK